MRLPLQALGCALVTMLGVSLSGCYSKVTGYNGKFTFAYASFVEFENFVKPIAPGAKLEMVVFANGSSKKLALTGAKSSAPGVLAVESVGERSLIVKAGAPGVADLEVTARDEAGNTLVDKMFLHVAKPATHGLEHVCTEGADAAYVAGETVDVFHNLATIDKRPVIGFGYVPLRIEPAAALEFVAQPQDFSVYEYRAVKPTARVTVRSLVDDGELTMRIVDRRDLKEASLVCGDDECRTYEGYTRYAVARVRYGQTPLCSQTALTKARSLTPEICSVTAKIDGEEGADSNRLQLAAIRGLKFGICKYEMTLPELDGGRGIRLTGEAKVGRIQFPGEGSAAPAAPAPAPAAGPLPKLPHGLSIWTLAMAWWMAPNAAAFAFLAWRRLRRERSTADESRPR